MSEFKPLDWTALVLEARRRRARDGLTQIGHANLAGVSRTTIRAFDHFEKTITLEKAEAILKVVGLVADEKNTSSADFAADSTARWIALTQSLPQGHAAHLKYGYHVMSYELVGRLSPSLTTSPDTWLKILRDVPAVMSIPPFRISVRPKLAPKITDNDAECWFARPFVEGDDLASDVTNFDYWRVSSAGLFCTIRGYREDDLGDGDRKNQGTYLDLRHPLHRAGDVLEHARLVINEIHKRELGEVAKIHFSAQWTGLSARVLVDWSDPTRNYLRGDHYVCRTDTVRSSVEADPMSLVDIKASPLKSLVLPLYQAFGFSDDVVLDDMIEERAELLVKRNFAGRGVKA